MPKIKAILEFIKKSDYKSLYLANLDRRYLSHNNKNIKISDVKYILLKNSFFINKCIISI